MPEDWSFVRITSNHPNNDNISEDYPYTNFINTSNGYMMLNDPDFDNTVSKEFFKSLRQDLRLNVHLDSIDLILFDLMMIFFTYYCHYKFDTIHTFGEKHMLKLRVFEKYLANH